MCAVAFWRRQATMSSTGWGWSGIIIMSGRNTRIGRPHTGHRSFAGAAVGAMAARIIRRSTRAVERTTIPLRYPSPTPRHGEPT